MNIPGHAPAAQSHADMRDITVGVLADTHIPDRVSDLHPGILSIFQTAGVSHILHAGDISCAPVLSALRQVAPVTAVRGNRDFLAGRLNMVEQLKLGGIDIALMHGHHGFLFYMKDKVQFTLHGYRLERYLNPLVRNAQGAKLIVFGHTHYSESTTYKDRLIFNPGSATFGPTPSDLPSIGLLYFSGSGEVRPEIIPLRGWKILNRKWVRE